MSKLSFIGGDAAAGSEVVSEAPPAETSQAPERDSQGRFVSGEATPPEGAAEAAAAETSTESAPAAPPEQSTAPPAEAPPPADPNHVPLGAHLDERERRQAAQRERDEAIAAKAALEKQLAELQASRQEPPPPMEPDQQRALELFVLRRDMSREFLAERHGEDLAKTLDDWAAKRCAEDHAFNQQVFAAAKPYELVKSAYDREQVLATVRPDQLADFKAWLAAKDNPSPDPAPALAAAAPVAATPAPAAPTPPPRSLASATGTGASAGTERLVTPEAGASFRNAIPS